MKYFAASTRGFYDPIIHGSTTIQVTDPAWPRPTTEVVVQPGDSYPTDDAGGVFTNETAEPVTITAPDWAAEGPMVTVPNPDTKIPTDAMEVPDTMYQELLASQREGMVIEADSNGMPVAVSMLLTQLGLREAVFPEARNLRKGILDAFTGIGFRALLASMTEADPAVAAAQRQVAADAAAAQVALLDVTKDPRVLAVTAEQGAAVLRETILMVYRERAAATPASVRSAFKEVTL